MLTQAMKLSVSVVVPTRHRPDLLQRCLSCLCGQSFDPRAYEILVVDDGPSVETRDLVELFASVPGPAIYYLATAGARGPAAARNLGWRAARAPVIAFTDDDTLPECAWLEQGLKVLGPYVPAACGRVTMTLPPKPTDYERNAAGLCEAEFVTANCFCRRALLEAVGGFDERFTAAWREDSDLHFALLEKGIVPVRASRAVVNHPIRPAPWGVSLRQQSKSRFEALLYKKHPMLYASKIGGAPTGYYVVAGLLVATLVLRGLPQLVAGLGWAYWTARFCARRLHSTSHAPRHVLEMALTSALIPPVAIFWRLVGAWKHKVWFW